MTPIGAGADSTLDPNTIRTNRQKRSQPSRRPLSRRLWSLIAPPLLVLSSARGFVVIHTHLTASVVYRLSAAVLTMLTLCGVVASMRFREQPLRLFRRLLIINALLGALNIAVDLIFGLPFDAASAYLYLAPFAVFIFIQVQPRLILVAARVIAVAIALSVTSNFIDTLQGPSGVARVIAYNTRLRPDVFVALSRTGEYYRAAGYTGSYHDSANILGMLACFFLLRFLIRHSLLDLGSALVSTFGMTLTQSAANIVVALAVMGSATGYVLWHGRARSILPYLAAAGVAAAALILRYGAAMSIFLHKFQSGYGQTALRNQLSIGDLVRGLPFALAGHAAAFQAPIINTEVGFLKVIVQLGLLPAAIFFLVLAYPIMLQFRSRRRVPDAWPALGACVFGFLSLVHYGSVLRITSVFVFYAFHASYLEESMRHARPRGQAQSATRRPRVAGSVAT